MVPGSVIENEIIKVRRNPWVEYFFRPVLITVLIMCFNISLVNLTRMINPAWRGTYFLIAMLLTTVEAIYSYRVLKDWRSRGVSVMRYRLTEWGILLLVLKILDVMGKPVAQIWADLQALWQDPFNNLIDIEFYILVSLALLAWMIATNTMADYEALHDPWNFRTDNLLPLDDLASRFFWGGIFLIIISGVTYWGVKAGVSSLLDFRRPTQGGIILNVLVYFTLGLVLLSQARLTTLLVRWEIQKITVSRGLIKQWAKYSFIFLGLVSLLIFFLPTSYTMGFLTSAGIVIGFLLGLIVFLVQLLLFLIHLPLIWLLSLFGRAPAEQAAPPLPPPPAVPTNPPAGGGGHPWLEALQSLAFWLVALVIAGYLIKFYLDDHPELVDLLKSFKPITMLVKLGQWLGTKLLGIMRLGAKMIPRQLGNTEEKQEEHRSDPGWTWFGWRRLAPRQQILAYYLNILKRAESRGPARQKNQTPYEYEPELIRSVPRVQSEIESLTQTFVAARYSRQEFDEAAAKQIKQQWQEIRREFRGKRKPPGESDTPSEEKPEE